MCERTPIGVAERRDDKRRGQRGRGAEKRAACASGIKLKRGTRRPFGRWRCRRRRRVERRRRGCNRSVDERFSRRKRDQRRKRGEGAMARDGLWERWLKCTYLRARTYSGCWRGVCRCRENAAVRPHCRACSLVVDTHQWRLDVFSSKATMNRLNVPVNHPNHRIQPSCCTVLKLCRSFTGYPREILLLFRHLLYTLWSCLRQRPRFICLWRRIAGWRHWSGGIVPSIRAMSA